MLVFVVYFKHNIINITIFFKKRKELLMHMVTKKYASLTRKHKAKLGRGKKKKNSYQLHSENISIKLTLNKEHKSIPS